jgi:hypothetical protein
MSNPNVIVKSNTDNPVMTAANEQMNNNLLANRSMKKMVLYDGYGFAKPFGSVGSSGMYTIGDATLYRTLAENKWSTLVVPFVPENLDEKKVPSSLSEGVLSFTDATAACDEPMLVRSTDGVDKITGKRNGTVGADAGDLFSGEGAPMQGVYIAGTVPQSNETSTNYIVSDNTMYKVDSEVNIKPFRAYFTVAGGSGNARITLRFDDTTIIKAIESAEAEAGALKDGKYVIDGKIVIVKNGVKYGANGQKLN